MTSSQRGVLGWGTALVVVFASPTLAFDTGPHFDITEDVLRAEGFSDNAIRTAQAANFLVDFHEFMGKKEFAKALDPDCRAKLASVLGSGDSLQHFDDLETPTEVAQRWDRRLDNIKRLAEAAHAEAQRARRT